MQEVKTKKQPKVKPGDIVLGDYMNLYRVTDIGPMCIGGQPVEGKFILHLQPIQYINNQFVDSGGEISKLSHLFSTVKLDRRKKIHQEAIRKSTVRSISDQIPEAFATLLPGEQFDFSETTSCIKVTVHYPEITVKNRNRLTHVIRDVFIRYLFDPISGKLSQPPQLTRRTLNPTEGSRLVYFPHSRSGFTGGEDWRSLCLGGGTVIALLVADLRYKFTKNKLEGLILTFESYLSWESRSGGPYTDLSTYVHKPKVPNYKLSSKVPDPTVVHRFMTTMVKHWAYHRIAVGWQQSSQYLFLTNNYYPNVQEESDSEGFVAYVQPNGYTADEVILAEKSLPQPGRYPDPLTFRGKEYKLTIATDGSDVELPKLDKSRPVLNNVKVDKVLRLLSPYMNKIITDNLQSTYYEREQKYLSDLRRENAEQEGQTADISQFNESN